MNGLHGARGAHVLTLVWEILLEHGHVPAIWKLRGNPNHAPILAVSYSLYRQGRYQYCF